jgi:hypothetical protein
MRIFLVILADIRRIPGRFGGFSLTSSGWLDLAREFSLNRHVPQQKLAPVGGFRQRRIIAIYGKFFEAFAQLLF